MSEQGNLIILSENLSTLCESVETCGIKDDTLAIFLITIDSSKLDQIKYYFANESASQVLDFKQFFLIIVNI